MQKDDGFNVPEINTNNMLSKHGLVLFALPGSKNVACMKSNVDNLGGPAASRIISSAELSGKACQPKKDA